MSKKEKTTSKFLNSTKKDEDKKSKKSKDEQIGRDRTYITPNEFKSKSPKKDNQEFFVSR
ncbi:MAG: YihY/virulence factor BrkB family protein, partial [Staphylococcus equorum]